MMARPECVVTCDTCGTAQGPYLNAVDARGTLARAGWIFPVRTTYDGRRSSPCLDICAACAPDWTKP